MLTAANPQMAVCRNLTRAISRTRTVEEIYETALDAIRDGLGVTRSSILLFDPDEVMRFKASRGLSAAYRRAVEGHTPWRPDTSDPAPIIVADVTEDSSLSAFLPAFEAEGIRGLAFIPLVGLGRVIGKFMLYYDVPHTPSGDELQLAIVIASQVAFAVERTKTEEHARRSEERLRFALEAAQIGTWDWDLTTESVQWSENLERVHGLAAGTFDGRFESYQREIHPDDRARVLGAIDAALAGGAPYDVEYRIVAPDGTVRWVEGKGRVERGPDGRPLRMSGICVNVTRRKEAEHARIEAMEEANRASNRLAAIVQSSGDAIVSKNLDGVITSWNRAAGEMYGYTAAEAVGRSIRLIIPDDLQAEEDDVLRRIRAGERVEIETRRRRKDGRILDISLMVSPVTDADGRIVGASKIARDITQRKRAEAERAELHRRLNSLVSASAALLNSPDTQSVVSTTISMAKTLLVADAYALWTNDPDEGTWRIARSEGVTPSFAARVIANDSARATGSPLVFSSPWSVSDVQTEPLLRELQSAYNDEDIRSLLVCPMRIDPDRAATLVFYYRTPRRFAAADIETAQTLANLAAAAMRTADLHDELRTERNATEAARRRAAFLADATSILSRSLDYQKTLAAVARLAVSEMADWCAVDIISDSGALQRVAVSHVDPAKVELAKQLLEKYPPDPSDVTGVHHVIRTGQPILMEAIPPELIASYARGPEHLRLLNELALTSYMCVPLISASGTLGAISFVYSESGRRYSDRDLAFAQELAGRAALAMENAYAYRRVHDANRVKDDFLATLSHELRTPLNAILGYAQMLSAGVVNGERQSNALAVLMRNAQALKQIIDDVLDVSRITSGKLRLNVSPVELSDILESAIATVQPAADARQVTISLSTAPGIAQVLGDPDRLQQVIWNLLSNAVKFTAPGGEVDVRLHQVDSSVELVVRDNGQGIDPAFLPHVFERFRQADGRFSREHAGLGLGLAIVRELTELHGGTVSAASDGPGTGATFKVRLPPLGRHRVAAAERPSLGGGATASRPLPDRLKGARILAVDNEEDALGLVRVILESAGADVMTVSSAEQALLILNDFNFDALIADIGMPGVDGLDLIRSVRQTLPAPANQIPAAALTAYARSEDRVAALASGFQMHIAKPVNPTELVAAIAVLVGRD